MEFPINQYLANLSGQARGVECPSQGTFLEMGTVPINAANMARKERCLGEECLVKTKHSAKE